MGRHPRVQEAWSALNTARWADALSALGAVRQPGEHRLRLGYQTEAVDPLTGERGSLLDRYGSPTRRAAWVVDTEHPGWRLELGGGGSIVAVKKPHEYKEFTVSESFPRGGLRGTVEVAVDPVADDLEALITVRKNRPQWAEWVPAAQRRLARLRGGSRTTAGPPRRSSLVTYLDIDQAA